MKLRRLVTWSAYEMLKPAEPGVKLSLALANKENKQAKKMMKAPISSSRIAIHLQNIKALKFPVTGTVVSFLND
jgi:hypothetical protein